MNKANGDIAIVEGDKSKETGIPGKGNDVNGTEKNVVDTSVTAQPVKDEPATKDSKPIVKEETAQKPQGEDAEDDNVVILDDTEGGDEFLDSTNKTKEESGDSEKPSEEKAQPTSHGRKKKERVFKRKVIRIPREVFDYMAKIEEDGTIRLNVTQFSLFFSNEISKKFVPVEVNLWDTTDVVPLMDVSVPPTAKENPSLIVDCFSNDPAERAAQEKRLQAMVEGRKKFAERQKRREAEIASGAKILPADGNANKKAENNKKSPGKVEEQTTKKNADQEKLPNKKRTAELSAPSSTPESGTAAKQPRLDEKNSAQSKNKKTFPKKTPSAPAKSGAQNASRASQRGSSFKSSSRGGPVRNLMSRRLSPSYRGSGSSPFVSPLMGRREWQSGPAPFQNQRYPQGNMYEEQMRYGEPYPFSDRRGGDTWVRPPTQPDEMYKLESVMRRAAQENSSSLEAVRQVEKMGLGSVVGAILNVVDRRNPGFPTYDTPSRGIPPLIDESYGRDPRMSGGLDYSPSPIRDISRYVEPLDDFCDSSRMGPSQSRPERITYPTMGGGGAGSGGGGGGAPPFGQSYPAFAAQSFGGMMDYGMSRGRSPAGRSYR